MQVVEVVKLVGAVNRYEIRSTISSQLGIYTDYFVDWMDALVGCDRNLHAISAATDANKMFAEDGREVGRPPVCLLFRGEFKQLTVGSICLLR